MTRRFVKRTGFVGMGSIEFKWHAGRRGYLVIEPTVGRADWQEEIATLCGENIPYRAYRHELGLPPLPRESPALSPGAPPSSSAGRGTCPARSSASSMRCGGATIPCRCCPRRRTPA